MMLPNDVFQHPVDAFRTKDPCLNEGFLNDHDSFRSRLLRHLPDYREIASGEMYVQ